MSDKMSSDSNRMMSSDRTMSDKMSSEVKVESITNFKQKNRDSIQFTWNNPKQHIIHGLQRTIISEICTLTIDMVMIDNNTSTMADQVLSLRLGLIPMESSLANEFLFPEECDCENFCHKCSIKMTLNVACYENEYHVTSKDLVSDDKRSRPIHESSLPDRFLGEDGFGPGIFLVTLTKNQCIKLSCIVRKGNGKIHGKWNPTSRVTFLPSPDVKVNLKRYHKINEIMEEKLKKDLEEQIRLKYTSKYQKNLEAAVKKELEEEMEEEAIEGEENGEREGEGEREKVREERFQKMLRERVDSAMDSLVHEYLPSLIEKNKIDWRKQWMESCPKGVFKGIDDINDIEDFGEKWWTPANNDECIVCNACITEAEDRLEIDNLITVTHNTSKFVCEIDGTGVLPPKEILLRAIDILNDKLKVLRSDIVNLLN